jgi:hypothetical protein
MECPEKINIESMPSCCNCILGGETSTSFIPRLQHAKRRTAKEKSTTSSQQILWEDVIL